MSAARGTILVLGIGNVLAGDDGFGVRVAEELLRRGTFADNDRVRIRDGATDGLALFEDVCAADRVIVIDVTHSDRAKPGERFSGTIQGIEPRSDRPLSLHEISFEDVLECARAYTGRLPVVTVFGIEPAHIEAYFVGLSPAIEKEVVPTAIKVEQAISSLLASH